MKRSVIVFLCLLVFFACKKDKEPEKEPPVQQPVTGPLKGRVTHFDQFGTPYNHGLNTTTVSIEGRSFTAITNTEGFYSLESVPSGTYTLRFEKPGCGMIKKENVIFNFRDTTTYNTGVADLPDFSVQQAYAKDTSWFSGSLSGIYYHAGSSPQHSMATVVAIIGKTPAIDLADPGSYLNYASPSVIRNSDFNRFFSYPWLKETYGFKTDSMLYLKIYPVAALAASYFDNQLNVPVYTAYGSPYPTVFTLKIP
jgi:hypothetical protein